MVGYVSRAEWGARPWDCAEPLPPISGFVVHYSAADADEQADHANCAARVRGIQRYHMDTRGWCDGAYNFIFCKHGAIFVVRDWTRKAGATGDANDYTLAFCFLGDDTAGRDDVTFDGRQALTRLIRDAQEKFGRDPVSGHRDHMSTSCPGQELYDWIRAKGWEEPAKPRVRFELWARRKVDVDGKKVWKPYLAAKSISVEAGVEREKVRAAKFVTRVTPKIAYLAATRKRPRIRRVVV